MLRILLSQRVAQQLQPLLVATLDIVNKAALKADAHGPVHADQQHDAGGQNGEKQFAGNTRAP